MSKMSHACEDHGQAIFVSSLDSLKKIQKIIYQYKRDIKCQMIFLQ